ncbi:MAG TPA: hypothetical protein VER96_24355 [Polyangiaceae bacterium]|nr:hypothetical protein [Polyangiaceae bacterium]
MLLKQVLAQHAAFAQHSALPTVLGDGYLYHYNFLYRHARDLALRLGFRFAETTAFPYHQLPLVCLEPIWEQRLIPVVPNVPALLHVEKRAPGRMDFWEVAERGLKRTALFHESIHCIARSVVRGLSPTARRSRRARVLELLFEESCANAAEALCCALAVTDWQRTFAQMHFYDTPLGCSMALERLGFLYAFELQAVACLYSNFLRDDISRARIWAIARRMVPPPHLELLGRDETVQFFERAFCINREFRSKTTAVSFKLAGLPGSLESLLSFDFFAEIAEGSRMRRALTSIGVALRDGVAQAPQHHAKPRLLTSMSMSATRKSRTRVSTRA